jgi:hypothetical protein
MNTQTATDDEGVGRLDEAIQEQRMILASRELEESSDLKSGARSSRTPGTTSEAGSRSHTEKSHRLRSLVAVLVVFAIVGVAAATVVLTHTIPPIPPSGLTSTCSTTTSSLTVVVPGSSGDIRFDCSPNAAIAVSTATSATPSWTPVTGYTTLYVFPHSMSLGTSCAATSGSLSLTPGTAVSLAIGNWDYCADFANAPAAGLASFIVSWSQ